MTFLVTVPIAAGVPPVARLQNAIVPIVTEIQADAQAIASLFLGPQWGIFDSDGNPAIVGDSVLSMEFKREWRVATYPIEPNGFQDYNKVEIPYDVSFMFAIGGTVQDRDAFLVDVDSACASTDLFSAVTPEAVYPTVNPTRYDYRREVRNGCTLIKVQVYCTKIRTSATSQFGNSSDPSTADAAQNGNVQAIPNNVSQVGTPAQNAAAAGVFGGNSAGDVVPDGTAFT